MLYIILSWFLAPTTKRQSKLSTYGPFFLCDGPYASPGKTVLYYFNVIVLYIVMYIVLLVLCFCNKKIKKNSTDAGSACRVTDNSMYENTEIHTEILLLKCTGFIGFNVNSF